jgi:carbonic anhydrase/acetyltransferase-like protein (isoleucine patch superfamily)
VATIVELDGVAPQIAEGVFLAPTAVLIGDVRIGERSSVWFGAVLRGDLEHIEVGAGTSIQDNAVLHCAEGMPTVVGDDCTVGHSALLEGCRIEDGAVVGMGAIVLHHAVVGAGAMLAAGGVLPDRATVGAGMLAAGVPAKEKRELTAEGVEYTKVSAEHYQQLRERYLGGARYR